MKVSRPSHITVLRKRRLVEASGRRKSESSFAVANPYGSSTPTSSNSAFAGIPMPTLISARSRRSPKASRRAATVDTSASGEVAPSTVRNRGARPSVRANRIRTNSGVMLMPASGT